MLDYRLSIKTSLDEVVTPQTDYRLSDTHFNEIMRESKVFLYSQSFVFCFKFTIYNLQ